MDHLAVLLNSRLLDFIFRRGSVPFRGDFFSANRQFIAPLPIQIPDADEAHHLENLGNRLISNATAVGREHEGFLDWLGDVLGVRVAELSGATRLRRYHEHTVTEMLTVLQANRARLAHDPTSRSFRDRFKREHVRSLERLAPLSQAIFLDEADADRSVYEMYQLTARQRAMVDAEFT